MNDLAAGAIRAHTFSMAGAYRTYAAQAFATDPSQEPIKGEIFFTMRSMTFRSGETLIDIPLSELNVELDNSGDGRVIFRHAGDGEWTIATRDTEVLECRSVPQIAEIATRVESQLVRRDISRRVKMVLMFFAGAVLVSWLGMVAVGAMVRSIVTNLPASVEKEYGNKHLKELTKNLKLLQNTNLVTELTTVAEPLLKVVPKSQEWWFHVVPDPTPNAFVLPGGYVFVTTGLLKFVERPEELLAVLAHELAHVTEKHGFRKQVVSAGPIFVFQVFLSDQSSAAALLLSGGSALLVTQSFSQEYEKEADDVGWEYMVKAKIDPRGMIDIFRKLQAYEMKHGGQSPLPKAFESHPDFAKRIARLEAKWKRLPQKSGFLDLSDRSVPNPGVGITNKYGVFPF
jgi:beta-barrel assembly-enhancing protease